MMQSTGDRVRAEAMAKGVAQGKVEGKAEGKAEGMAEGEAKATAATLTKLLRLKFRRLPAKAKTRIGKASVDELDAWTESILTANSLDEVFAAKPR